MAFAEYNSTRFQLLGKINKALDTLPPHYSEVWDYDRFDVPLPPMDVDSYAQYDILRNHTDILQQTLDDLTQQIFILRHLPIDFLPNPDLPLYRAPRSLDVPQAAYPLFDFLTFYLRLKPLIYPRKTRNIPTDEEQIDIFVPLRNKRWLPALGAVASIISAGARVVGTFMGLYNSAELAAITARVSSLEHTQDLLLHLSNRHTQQIQSLADSLSSLSRKLLSYIALNPGFLYVEINNHLVDFERKVVRATNVIQQLHHRRLAVDWLDDTQLHTLHLTVQEYAASRSMTLLTSHPSDYFQLEVSYFRSGSDITALLHIPCIMSPSLLTIYRYVPFPIPLPVQANHSPFTIKSALSTSRLHDDDGIPDLRADATPLPSDLDALYLVPDSDMIAISGDESFRLVSQADLAGCIQRNHIFLCESQHVLRTNLSETCLGSLYQKNTIGVRANCKFDRRPLLEKVYQISGSVYLVYSPSPFTTRVDCLNGSSFSAFFGQTTKLTIPNGCQVKLCSHSLRVDEKFHMPLPPEVTDWKWDPLSLPADLLGRASYLDQAFVDLIQNVSQLREDAMLDSELPARVDHHISARSWFGIIMWVFVVIGTITPFALCGYAYFLQRHPRGLLSRVKQMIRTNPSSPPETQEPTYAFIPAGHLQDNSHSVHPPAYPLLQRPINPIG